MLPFTLLILFLLWITPVKAGALLRWDREGARCRLGILIWGIRRQWEIAPRKGALARLMRLRKKRRPAAPFFKGFSSAGGKLLRRAVHLQRAEIDGEIGLHDAAASALLGGSLQAAGGMIPGLRLSIRPRLDGRWALRGLCIAESRLGILCVAFILALRAGKKEEKPWIIPSAA